MLGNVYITVFAFFWNAWSCATIPSFIPFMDLLIANHNQRLIYRMIGVLTKMNVLLVKLIVKKNLYPYVLIIISTVGILTLIKIFTGILYILTGYMVSHNGSVNNYMLYKINGLQMLFTLLGVVFILAQYYYVMMINCDEYRIFKTLGATRRQMHQLIFMQNASMAVFTIPIICILETKITHKLLFMIKDKGYLSGAMKNCFNISMYTMILLVVFIMIYGLIICRKIRVNKPISIGMEM